jgi:hypothetical protein
MIRTILSLGALAASGPALAQDAKTARFQVTGVEIALPVPKGYCEPQGHGIAVAQLVAASDDDNVTDLTLHQCGDETRFVDYYILKTTKVMLTVAVSREELIAAMVDALDDPAVKASVDPAKLNPEIERGFAGVTGQKLSVDTSVRWVGHDDVCVYLAGTVTFKDPKGDSARAMSGCMTAVGGRAVNIYRYSDGADPKNAARYLADVKAMALSMQGAPAH